MPLTSLLHDKTIKAKAKVETISNWLLEGSLSITAVMAIAGKENDQARATCIESIEFATRQHPAIADAKLFTYMIQCLGDHAPRVQWESAKVIGNIAFLFPAKLDKAISGLLANTTHNSTVVRWSAAFALGEILKLKTKHNADLLPAVEVICRMEQDNAIRKKYLDAFKKAGHKCIN